MDKKTALVDTVKGNFSDELIRNISEIIDPKQIDVVISNHAEMDHSGGLPHLMHLIGEDKPLYCSHMGKLNLSKHFSNDWNYNVVRDGETIDLGNRKLTFIEAKMFHWPDSMFTYLNEDNILFSSDGFGQHYANFERFEDAFPGKVMIQAKKYFANILLPYSARIIEVLEKIAKMKLKINIICPDHGVIWRKNYQKIIDKYIEWSKQENRTKSLVVYDTMWNSTKLMAECIASGLNQVGVEAQPMSMQTSHRSDVMTKVLDAGAIIIGSSTLNNQVLPTIADMLTYMKGLKPKRKLAAAFGSYGWSGESVKYITNELKSMGG